VHGRLPENVVKFRREVGHERPTQKRKSTPSSGASNSAPILQIYAETWQGEANSATGDDQRLASLKTGHWCIIEKTIRELADPRKSNQAIN
jgi:hypothetical protein